jgi:hypothetical protein
MRNGPASILLPSCSIRHSGQGETWGFGGAPVEHVETHAAHVFRGDRLQNQEGRSLPYLDFRRSKSAGLCLKKNWPSTGLSHPISIDVIEVRGEPVLRMALSGTGLAVTADGAGRIDGQLARRLAR